MSQIYKRKYGEQAIIPFELYELDGQEHQTGASPAVGDVKISKDEGVYANTSNVFVLVNNKTYKIILTIVEMQAARISLNIIDQTSPKAWMSRTIEIETYGHVSAEHELDLDSPMRGTDSALTEKTGFALSNAGIDAILSRPISNLDGSGIFRSLYGAICKLVNKVNTTTNVGKLTIFKTDDLSQLATQTLTEDALADPVVGVDTD